MKGIILRTRGFELMWLLLVGCTVLVVVFSMIGHYSSVFVRINDEMKCFIMMRYFILRFCIYTRRGKAYSC